MFKHNADSIKESSSKQFISQLERQTWNNKAELIHNHDNVYYRKSEIDDKIERGSLIVKDNLVTLESKPGIIKNIVVYGNSIQPDSSNYEDIRHVGEVLDNGKARLKLISKNFNLCVENDFTYNAELTVEGILHTTDQNRKVTPFIRVRANSKYLIRFKPDDDVRAYGHIYDHDKKSIRKIYFDNPNNANGFDTSIVINTPADAQYIRVRFPGNATEITISEIDDVNHMHIPNEISETEIILPCQLEGILESYITREPTITGNDDNFIADRLFKDRDGRYKIEKNIATYKFSKSDVDLFGGFEDKDQCFKIGIAFTQPFAAKHSFILCNKFKPGTTAPEFEYKQTQVALYKHIQTTEIRFAFKKSEYPDIVDLESARAQMSKIIDEGLYIKYVTATPEIIELPSDMDIALKSFEGVTNVYSDSNVVHDIKCEVPISLSSAASIVSTELDKQLEIVSGIEGLKDSQTLTYETSKGVVDVNNSHNGYIDNVYIQGKTLYNLMNLRNVKTAHHSSIDHNIGRIVMCTRETGYTNFFTSKEQFKPNTKYTIFCNVFVNTLQYDDDKLNGNSKAPKIFRVSDDSEETIFRVPYNDIERHSVFGYNEGETGIKKMVITTVDEATYNNCKYGIRSWISSAAVTGSRVEFSIVIVEGDHMDAGIVSFTPDVINVGMWEETQLTTTSANLLPLREKPDFTTGYECLTTNSDGSVTFINNTGIDDPNYTVVDASYKLKLKPHTDYMLKVFDINNIKSHCVIGYRIENASAEQYITTKTNHINSIIFNSNVSGEVKIRFTSENQRTQCNSTFRVALTELSNSEMYSVEPDSDNKKLQTSNGEVLHLRSVGLKTFDTIEKINGVYNHVKRCEEVRYNGNNNEYWYHVETLNDTIGFGTDLSKKAFNKSLMYVTSNRMLTLTSKEAEGVRIGNWGNALFIYIKKDRLAGETVDDFKAWLQENHLIATYRLEVPEYTIYQDMSLKAFNGVTNVSLRMSALMPDVLSFNAPGYIGTTINTMRDKVRYLERKLQTIRQAALISTLNDVNNQYKIEQINKF